MPPRPPAVFLSLLASLVVVLPACASAPPALPPAPLPPPPLPRMSPVTSVGLPAGVRAILPLPAGESVRLGPGALLTAVSRDGLVRATLRDPALAGTCSILPWGPRALAACPTADPPPLDRQLPTIPMDVSVRLFRVNALPDGFIPGHDGRTLTLPAPCIVDSLATASTDVAVTACTVSPGRPWRDWRAIGFRGRVLDVFDGLALVAIAESDTNPTDVRLYDIDAARWLPLELPDPAGQWLRAGFTLDGRVIGLIRTGTRESPRAWVVLGAPGHVLEATPLDAIADDVGVIDRRRMVFTHGDRVAVTDDGGATFRSVLPSLPPGGAAQPSIRPPARAGVRITCGEDLCVVDGVLTVPLPLPTAADPVLGG